MSLDELLDNEPVYQKVEDFIKKLHEKNIQLSPKAQTFMVPTQKTSVWGKPIQVSCTLSDAIAKEMAHYQRIIHSQTITEALLAKSQAKNATIEDVKNFTDYINMRSAVHGKKSEVANSLFLHIELAQTNNLVEEIGLESKLKSLEMENTSQKRLIESLEKLNKDLKKENDSLHKCLPNFQRGKTEVGDVST
ncbi:MAG: hypothetical protein M1490_00020 [Candidatus Bathyarchaeota archaeon]|nr:hypothetical protein [Candidatus Bathyarchaeota archaeon]